MRFYQHAELDFGLLRELGQHLGEPGVAEFLASLPVTPSSILNAIARGNDLAALRVLAQNPNYVQRLSEHENGEVRAFVAQSRHLALPQAQKLAKDPDVRVRVALARNPMLPTNLQLTLSQDPVPFVRMALLGNRKLDEEFQIGLGDDIDTTVHLATLLTPRLSVACMKIWGDFDEEVGQLALARRGDLPSNVLQQLARSRYASVRLALLEHQQLSEGQLSAFAAQGDEAVGLALLRRPDLPEALFAALWRDGAASAAVRAALAGHAGLPDAVGLALAATGDAGLQEALALNPGAALGETRRQLAATADGHVLKLLLANPLAQTDAELLSALIVRASEDVLPHLALRRIDCAGVSAEAKARLAACPLPSVRALAA